MSFLGPVHLPRGRRRAFSRGASRPVLWIVPKWPLPPHDGVRRVEDSLVRACHGVATVSDEDARQFELGRWTKVAVVPIGYEFPPTTADHRATNV